MTPVIRSADGAKVALGATLARAGEGTIYAVAGRDDLVAKVFHSDLRNLEAKRAKVSAMTASPPAGSIQSDGFVVLTWPQQELGSIDGTSGYLMRRVDTTNAVEIHSLSNPSNRRNPLPSAPQWTTGVTWRHLVNVAANLCLAVDTVHRVDAVIGDFQERNILVSDTTQVTLVDCDSMQFTSPDGQQFLCGVGRPEFTAPELGSGDLSITARAKSSDHFALAVHIHLLLMGGNHPFLRGQWTGSGDQPDALALAKSGQWAGGPGSALHTHPLAPPISFLPIGIQRLFIRAFTDGVRDPELRPSAAEWSRALKSIAIVTCSREHQIPASTAMCPWCAVDDERATRRDERAKSDAAQVDRTKPAPSIPPDSLPAAVTSGRRNASVALVTMGAALIAVAAIGIAALASNSETVSAPTTPTDAPTVSLPSATSTTTDEPAQPPPPPPTVPSTYPPPDAQSYDSVFQNAKVGECVNRVMGAAQKDGSLTLTSFYLTDCGAPDVTDQVTARASDVSECHDGWARHEPPLIVLCLTGHRP